MWKLLLIGRDTERLMDLAVRPGGAQQITNVVVTEDPVARAVEAGGEGWDQTIVCLDALADLSRLLLAWPHLVMVADCKDRTSIPRRRRGCFVLIKREEWPAVASRVEAPAATAAVTHQT